MYKCGSKRDRSKRRKILRSCRWLPPPDISPMANKTRILSVVICKLSVVRKAFPDCQLTTDDCPLSITIEETILPELLRHEPRSSIERHRGYSERFAAGLGGFARFAAAPKFAAVDFAGHQ